MIDYDCVGKCWTVTGHEVYALNKCGKTEGKARGLWI